jgi:hypothetical protein
MINVLLACMWSNNHINKFASVIIVTASFQNFLISKPIILAITTKSGALHLTISIKKNDLLFLNIVLEKNKPNNKVTAPLITMNAINPNHPQVAPKIAVVTNANTTALALQIVIGMIKIEMKRSFLELELLAIITAGTLHPNPVNKLTTLLPLIPNRSNAPSSNTDTRDSIPICCIKLMHRNKIANNGIKVKTVKKPTNKPSVKK